MKTIISHNKEETLEQLMGLIGFPQLFLCCILSLLIDVISLVISKQSGSAQTLGNKKIEG